MVSKLIILCCKITKISSISILQYLFFLNQVTKDKPSDNWWMPTWSEELSCAVCPLVKDSILPLPMKRENWPFCSCQPFWSKPIHLKRSLRWLGWYIFHQKLTLRSLDDSLSQFIVILWYFVTKIVLTYSEKKLFYLVIEKNFWNSRFEGRDFAKILRSITRTIYSKSERSEQFLVTDCFFNSFLRSNKLEQIEFKLDKNIGI